jgi:hypothetical protein
MFTCGMIIRESGFSRLVEVVGLDSFQEAAFKVARFGICLVPWWIIPFTGCKFSESYLVSQQLTVKEFGHWRDLYHAEAQHLEYQP